MLNANYRPVISPIFFSSSYFIPLLDLINSTTFKTSPIGYLVDNSNHLVLNQTIDLSGQTFFSSNIHHLIWQNLHSFSLKAKLSFSHRKSRPVGSSTGSDLKYYMQNVALPHHLYSYLFFSELVFILTCLYYWNSLSTAPVFALPFLLWNTTARVIIFKWKSIYLPPLLKI